MPAPESQVVITARTKRGEFYEIQGLVGGKKVAVEIHAEHVERRPLKEAEALMKRSLYGTATLPPEAA